jgi:hypothetical protein
MNSIIRLVSEDEGGDVAAAKAAGATSAGRNGSLVASRQRNDHEQCGRYPSGPMGCNQGLKRQFEDFLAFFSSLPFLGETELWRGGGKKDCGAPCRKTRLIR